MPSRTRKFRGLRTHGRGKKAGRGAGIIGGHGNAGMSKSKRIQMLKYDRAHYGHTGFKRPQCTVAANSTLNVGELQEQLDRYVSLGFAVKSGDAYDVDLGRAGIDKLLGAGTISAKVSVTVPEASAQAREKILAAGGSVAGGEAAEASEE